MPRPILITGATGLLGSYLVRTGLQQSRSLALWSHRAEPALFGLSPRPVELTDRSAVQQAWQEIQPGYVIHSAALASVASCYRDPNLAQQVNVASTETLVELCRAARVPVLYISTDLVFSGEAAPYAEDALPNPLSEYGKSKRSAEALVLTEPANLVARLSLLVGPTLTKRLSFFDQQVRDLRAGRAVRYFVDEWRTPLDYETASLALLALQDAGCTGLVHVGGPTRLSRWQMGVALAESLGISPELAVGVTQAAQPSPEPRPADTSLCSARWRSVCPEVTWPRYEEVLLGWMAAR